jgi:hypothetical protein
MARTRSQLRNLLVSTVPFGSKAVFIAHRPESRLRASKVGADVQPRNAPLLSASASSQSRTNFGLSDLAVPAPRGLQYQFRKKLPELRRRSRTSGSFE